MLVESYVFVAVVAGSVPSVIVGAPLNTTSKSFSLGLTRIINKPVNDFFLVHNSPPYF